MDFLDKQSRDVERIKRLKLGAAVAAVVAGLGLGAALRLTRAPRDPAGGLVRAPGLSSSSRLGSLAGAGEQPAPPSSLDASSSPRARAGWSREGSDDEITADELKERWLEEKEAGAKATAHGEERPGQGLNALKPRRLAVSPESQTATSADADAARPLAALAAAGAAARAPGPHARSFVAARPGGAAAGGAGAASGEPGRSVSAVAAGLPAAGAAGAGQGRTGPARYAAEAADEPAAGEGAGPQGAGGAPGRAGERGGE
ncbi:MAG: hypothetical protein NTX64_14020, partial [Elusimicrobia bacterium]|nr:hypothetical protein [Elusimicrobiota bacterium]